MKKKAEIQLINEFKRLLEAGKGIPPGKEEAIFSLLDIIGEGVRILDKDFRIIFENKAHRDILGSNVGEYCYRAYQKRDKVCENCAVSMSFEDGKVHKDARRVVTGKGLRYVEVTSSNLRDRDGDVIAGVEIVRDVTERKRLEDEKQKLISALREALNSIKVLKGLIPVCAWCKKARNDKGYWDNLENYIREHSEADFTHGICPECLDKAFSEMDDREESK